jgi:hypothetical protein
MRPDDMAALVMMRLLARHLRSIHTDRRRHIGCANRAGEDNHNVATALLAACPFRFPASR